MRADVAAVLAAVLASGATWLVMRPERAAPPAADAPSVASGEPAAAPPPRALEARPRPDERVEALERELAVLREEKRVAETASQLDAARAASGLAPLRPTSGAALEGASLKELEDSAAAIRREVGRRLLTVPDDAKQRYADLVSRPDAGIGRILHRGRFESVVDVRGGGAYWSFATKSNSYDESPDLELQQGKFSSGFYGSSHGEFLDLGGTPLDRVPDRAEVLPPTLTEEQRPAWESLWAEHADFKKGTESRVPAAAGHTYVLRSVLPEEHDHLVAFEVIGGDDTGFTIVHRILKTFPMASTRRR